MLCSEPSGIGGMPVLVVTGAATVISGLSSSLTNDTLAWKNEHNTFLHKITVSL